MTGLSRPLLAQPTLSPRETEILRLMASGLGNSAIASVLEISPHTVRTHVQAVLTKLNRSSRVAAVGAARQSGLLR
jgi:DNA-binding NarL/FixJ family response regulator